MKKDTNSQENVVNTLDEEGYELKGRTPLEEFIVKGKGGLTYAEWAIEANKRFGTHLNGEGLRSRYRVLRGSVGVEHQELPPSEQVAYDRKVKKLSEDKSVTAKKYREALDELEQRDAELSVLLQLHEAPRASAFLSPKSPISGEATAVALASDWHIEETVLPENCDGMNFYNLAESKRRAEMFFDRVLHLVNIERKNVQIEHLITGLLGDFISGDIHEDITQSCSMRPTFALLRAQEYIESGINYLLDNSDLKLTFVCHSGNHGRKGKEQMIANEAGHSLEFLMYHSLAQRFEKNKRVQFMVNTGYHSYLDVYGIVLRFHHGHFIRYGGGVGGITIPVNKAIAQWNKTQDARVAPFYESIKDSINEWNLARPADIDCFGHFHQFLDGGNFVANGSMIGYSPYAVNIKGGYEPPRQVLFFLHSKLGHYDTRRILFHSK